MKNMSICVVMSTYNGEKYLEEQLVSLFNQTLPNINIFVRDDGSSDRTVEILEKYKKQGKLNYIKGKNLGYGKSFVKALKLAGDFDYYAFCDQDDVWFPNKLEEAIKKINTKNLNKPVLYFSNENICDENLNFICRNNDYKILTFVSSVAENIAFGNTIVINKKLKDIFCSKKIEDVYNHDAYVYTLAHAIGEVYYDKNSYIQYRKHGNNVTDQCMSFLKFQIWRIKKYIINDYFSKIKKQNIEFERLFSEQMKPEDKKLLKLFTNKKYSLIVCLKKMFYPYRFRQRISDEIILRIMFLTGKI